jgi:NADP-dependent aldehyde dehydrogenase
VPEGSEIVTQLSAATVPAPAPLLNGRIQDGYVTSLRDMQQRDDVTTLRAGDGSLADPPEVTLLQTSLESVLADPDGLIAEIFGPAGVVVTYSEPDRLVELAGVLDGQLTATVVADDADGDVELARALLPQLTEKAGRVLWNQWPTGVSVTHAQQHGGPYPATTASTTTAVGTASIGRFLRPVAYQNLPQALLPEPLQDANPLGVPQQIDG